MPHPTVTRTALWAALILMGSGLFASCKTIAGQALPDDGGLGGASGDGDGGDGDGDAPPGDGDDDGDGDGDTGTGGASGDGGTGGMTGSGGQAGSAAGGNGLGGAASTEPPSCEGDDGDECGPSDSCCTSLWVPTSVIGIGRSDDETQQDYYPAGVANEQPQTDVEVQGFYMDKYEVTVSRFRKFVAQYDGTPPAPGAGAARGELATGWSAGFNANAPASKSDLVDEISCSTTYPGWTDEPSNHEQAPINCIDWYVAFQFCAWDGGRLPTEAEWELAAAGAGEGQLFPWGDDETNCDYANLGCAHGDPFFDVGSFPAGVAPHGHMDLAGSMAEWVLDRYSDTVYELWDDAANDPVNPVYLGLGTDRVMRGSWFADSLENARNVLRVSRQPEQDLHGVGIRCVREGTPSN